MINNNSQKFMIVDRNYLLSVIQDLRSLDVRGYESNEKLVGMVKDLQMILVSNAPVSFPDDGRKDTVEPTDDKK